MHVYRVNKDKENTPEKILRAFEECQTCAQVAIYLWGNEYGIETLRNRLNTLIKYLNLEEEYKSFKEKAKNIKFLSAKIEVKNALTKNSPMHQASLRRYIYRNNILPYQCLWCGLKDTYNNKPLILQLDHIDGDRKNNSIDNLRWLCPNCHSQTETYCRREGLGRYKNTCPICKEKKIGKLVGKSCRECFLKSKGFFILESISREDLIFLINNYPLTKISKELKCSFESLKKRLEVLNISYNYKEIDFSSYRKDPEKALEDLKTFLSPFLKRAFFILEEKKRHG